jgi:hypothetical protein
MTSLLMLLALPAVAAEPVLVPDFTPSTTSEFAMAFMLQEKAVEVLRSQGYIVIDAATAERASGASLDACADIPQCPFAFMEGVPARIAVVVSVERRGEDVVGVVDMHTSTQFEPVDTWEIPVHPGLEMQFAQGVLGATSALSIRLGPPPPTLSADAEALMSAGALPAPADPWDEEAAPAHEPSAMKEGPRRHALGSLGQLDASGLSLDEWVAETRSHAGRLVLELGGGIGVGDVSRSADLHVDVDDTLTVSTAWFQEGPASGAGGRLSLSVGYAPLTWFEPALGIGLQLGRRDVETSWSLEGEVQEVGRAEGGAVQLLLTPRARFYVPPTGIAKPFVEVGAELRFFDGYDIASTTFAYLEPPGGVVVGPQGGVGWLVDPVRAVGFLIEGTFTWHTGLRAGPAEDGRLAVPRPTVPESGGFTVGLGGAIQVRI